jgi:hypothetical protein
MLIKALKNLLTPKAEKIETTQDLRTKCLDRDICALLLKGAKTSPNYVKTAMDKLLVEYPKVAFAAVDTSVLYIKGLEAEYLTEFQPDRPRFAVFEKVGGPSSSSSSSTTDDDTNNTSRLKTSVVTLPDSVTYGPMSNLIASVIQKTATMQKVSSLPTIKTRTKKLEQEERAKRQRRQEQQQRQHQRDTGRSSSSGGGGDNGYFSSSENDGSPDGRRAERERRRAEHRASNPNYKDKTPEEIAEMEQQRRRRMEEEAAKWNVAPEDAEPEDGSEPLGDSHDDTTMDWDEEQDQESDAGADKSGTRHDDDEDVMDLDE